MIVIDWRARAGSGRGKEQAERTPRLLSLCTCRQRLETGHELYCEIAETAITLSRGPCTAESRRGNPASAAVGEVRPRQPTAQPFPDRGFPLTCPGTESARGHRGVNQAGPLLLSGGGADPLSGVLGRTLPPGVPRGPATSPGRGRIRSRPAARRPSQSVSPLRRPV